MKRPAGDCVTRDDAVPEEAHTRHEASAQVADTA